jgi:Ca-activated chloride channel homolog
MIELHLPWLLLLLPLPLLVWRFLPPAPEGREGALRVPFYEALTALPSGSARPGAGRRIALGLKALAWVLLVIAAAQPRWIGEPRQVATEGRDLMLAVDLSGSMAREDFDVRHQPVDRLSVVKAVARDFLSKREGDRVGLILFGTRAYLQAPLTFDRDTVAALLEESEVGLAGEDTAIGDAIGLAVKHLRDRPADERVLVLLSDGAANAGALAPLRAADLAARAGVRIYTIGVGTDTTVVQTPFGPQLIAGGSDLDEKTLSEIARITGGAYFRARDTAGLVQVYQQIDQLEPTEGDRVTVRPERALFYWPLGLAMALAGGLALARASRGVRWPRLVPEIPVLSRRTVRP